MSKNSSKYLFTSIILRYQILFSNKNTRRISPAGVCNFNLTLKFIHNIIMNSA